MRPTLQEIARAAQVSTATVDRVVNDRPGVKPRTRERVLNAARRIGYLAEPAQAPVLPPIRLTALLPEGKNAFMAGLADQLRQQASAIAGLTLSIAEFPLSQPQTLASRLVALRGRCEGLALVAVDHPAVREAIRLLAQAGCPVVTLASDIHGVPRLAYIGIDNSQAGRLAGYLTGRFLGQRPAKVAFFSGSLAYRGHQEREMGFRQILSEDFPATSLVARREVQEDRDRAHAETLKLLAQFPDLAAIYNAGGATQGIARALKEAGRDQDLVFVAHETTAGNTTLLLDGTLDAVIDQNPRIEAREALAALSAAARGGQHRVVSPRLQIVFRENLPAE